MHIQDLCHCLGVVRDTLGSRYACEEKGTLILRISPKKHLKGKFE